MKIVKSEIFKVAKISLIVLGLLAAGFFGFAVGSNGSSQDIYLDDLPSSVKFVVESHDTYWTATEDNGKILCSGTDAIPVVNNAMGNLTSGRTWKETVVLKGGMFEGDHTLAQIAIPNYTVLDFQGGIFKVKDNTPYTDDYGVFRNRDDPATDIEIKNMIFDDNEEGAPDAWSFIMWFQNTENLVVDGCDLQSPNLEYCILLESCSDVAFKNCISYTWFDSCEADSFFIQDCTLKGGTIDVTGDYCKATDCELSGDAEIQFRGDDCYISQCRGTQTSSLLKIRGDNGRISDNRINCTTSVSSLIYMLGHGGTISDNIIDGYGTASGTGIIAIYSNNSIIADNSISNFNTGYIDDENYNTNIHGNEVTDCQYGIDIYQSDEALVFSNMIEDCEYGIRTRGLVSKPADHNMIENNKLQGTMTYGVHLHQYSNYNTVRNNEFDVTGTVILDDGSNNKKEYNIGYTTENAGTVEASNDDWIPHGLVDDPQYNVWLTVEETDANYCIQLKATNSTHFQIYLYDLTAGTLETVDKTINWRADC